MVASALPRSEVSGAGIADLSAGCYLQMNGHRTQIFELHDKPGGLPMAAISGRYVAQIICKADERTFVNTVP